MDRPRAPAPDSLPPHYPYMRAPRPYLPLPRPPAPAHYPAHPYHEVQRAPSPSADDKEDNPDVDNPASPPDIKPQFLKTPLPDVRHIKVEQELENTEGTEHPGAVGGVGGSGGVFGGLVSYFSSQREDELDA